MFLQYLASENGLPPIVHCPANLPLLPLFRSENVSLRKELGIPRRPKIIYQKQMAWQKIYYFYF